MSDLITIAADLVRIDSRSFVSNLAVADRIEAELAGFDIERLDYVDPAGIAKRALVAHRGPAGGLALSGHMDTVPATGWDTDPWSGHIADGHLHGLGSTDMKGPVAACIVAARELPANIPITLLFTTDEETSKQGARLIATNSALVRQVKPRAILIAEKSRAGFIEQLARTPTPKGRFIVARTAASLYPKSPQLVEYADRLDPEWWYDTNVGRSQVLAYLRVLSRLLKLPHHPTIQKRSEKSALTLEDLGLT